MYKGLFYLNYAKEVIRHMDHWSIKGARYQAQAKPFTGALEFIDVNITVNGYVYFTFKDVDTDIVYPVFRADASVMLKQLFAGMVSGTFAFRKHGSIIGIYLVADTKPIELVDRAIL